MSEDERRCAHADLVELPDGTVVRAASLRHGDSASVGAPEFGVYLDPAWTPVWAHCHIEWPDYGLPADPVSTDHVLAEAAALARSGAVVEIGCIGGHGRTGTALAMLALAAGLTTDPVAWVRRVYCDKAIETNEQESFVRAWAERT